MRHQIHLAPTIYNGKEYTFAFRRKVVADYMSGKITSYQKLAKHHNISYRAGRDWVLAYKTKMRLSSAPTIPRPTKGSKCSKMSMGKTA